jgi:hypothetical protein
MKLTQKNNSITCLGDWERFAGPKRPEQWVRGRSAYEFANAWCKDGVAVPPAMAELLDSHEATRGVRLVEGIPEARIRFDQRGGEPRNADLALRGEGPDGPVAITIEAKADESFGQLVSEALADALDRGLEANSGAIARVQNLVASLLPPRGADKRSRPALRNLRYQLLTAAAGTLSYAREIGAARALLVIHEFVTDRTKDSKHDANARELDLFVKRMSAGEVDGVDEGQVVGPLLRVSGQPLFTAPADLYVGKIVTRLRT